MIWHRIKKTPVDIFISFNDTVSKLNKDLDQYQQLPTNLSRKFAISSNHHTPPRRSLHRRSTRRRHHHSRLPLPELLHLQGLQEGEWRGWKVEQREQARLQVQGQVQVQVQVQVEEQLCPAGEDGWRGGGRLTPATAEIFTGLRGWMENWIYDCQNEFYTWSHWKILFSFTFKMVYFFH